MICVLTQELSDGPWLPSMDVDSAIMSKKSRVLKSPAKADSFAEL